MLLQRDVFTILFLFHLLDAFKWCQCSNTIYLSPCVEMSWFYFLGALMNYHTWCRLVINRSWLTRHMFLCFHCQHYSDRSNSCPTVQFVIFLLVVIKYDYEAELHGAFFLMQELWSCFWLALSYFNFFLLGIGFLLLCHAARLCDNRTVFSLSDWAVGHECNANLGYSFNPP